MTEIEHRGVSVSVPGEGQRRARLECWCVGIVEGSSLEFESCRAANALAAGGVRLIGLRARCLPGCSRWKKRSRPDGVSGLGLSETEKVSCWCLTGFSRDLSGVFKSRICKFVNGVEAKCRARSWVRRWFWYVSVMNVRWVRQIVGSKSSLIMGAGSNAVSDRQVMRSERVVND